MVSASILAIGMVLVARGLLTASGALQTVDNRVEAFQFLEAKVAQLQQQSLEAGGLPPGHETGATTLNHRAASWSIDIEPVDLAGAARSEGPADPQRAGTISGIEPDEPKGARPEGATSEPPGVAIAQVRLTVSWQEARRNQEAALVTYLGYKAPPVGEHER